MPFVFKKIASTVAGLLTYIINLSFQQDIFSNKLKTVKIILLHKKSSADKMVNYWAITLFSSKRTYS